MLLSLLDKINGRKDVEEEAPILFDKVSTLLVLHSLLQPKNTVHEGKERFRDGDSFQKNLISEISEDGEGKDGEKMMAIGLSLMKNGIASIVRVRQLYSVIVHYLRFGK